MAIVTPIHHHGMGWKKDLPDPRDRRWSYAQEPRPSLQQVTAPPPAADTRHLLTYHLDQGNIGSCTANSASYIYDGLRALDGLPPLYLSRLSQYYNSRIPDNTVNSDSGASIRNAIKAMVDYGACPESMWPYDIPRFRERPSTPCYTFGADRQVIEYLRVSQSLTELMGAIASGYPVIYGMMIYRGFEDLPAHGMVPMPSPGENPLGGHSGVLCHYWTDSNTGGVYFTDKNTWGTSHGAGGFAFLPAQYILDPQLCDDFWIIRKVETEVPTPPVPPPPPVPGPPMPPLPPIYNVGPGVLKLMDQLGDRPQGHEKYFPQGPYSKSITQGELYFYEWEELTDTVKATPIEEVLIGTR